MIKLGFPKQLLVVAALLGCASTASAAAIITDGTVTLGVDNAGQLNIPGGSLSGEGTTTFVGLRDNLTNFESTSDGCLCEGWGAGVATAGGTPVFSGSTDNALGTFNVDQVSFTSTASTATSVVNIDGLTVTHDFAPAAETPDLYRVTVTLTNSTAATMDDVRYTRVMDWDIEPTAFSEFTTIQGTAAATAVLFASDNGFSSPDPFAGPSSIIATGDVVDSGPTDHGALFDFGFGALAPGASVTFDIFYGASRTEAAALAALGAVKAEVYSLGQTNSDPAGTGTTSSGTTDATFIFGFSGVGGIAVPPSGVPELNGSTASMAFALLLGFALLIDQRRRRSQSLTLA